MHVLQDLCIYLPVMPLIWCDNISVISLASNLVFHAGTKHIEIDYHYVMERVLQKGLDVQFVSTKYQVADIFFMKGLSKQEFKPSFQFVPDPTA